MLTTPDNLLSAFKLQDPEHKVQFILITQSQQKCTKSTLFSHAGFS